MENLNEKDLRLIYSAFSTCNGPVAPDANDTDEDIACSEDGVCADELTSIAAALLHDESSNGTPTADEETLDNCFENIDWGDVGLSSEVRQRRPGSRHGRGGRRPVPLSQDREISVSQAVFRLLMKEIMSIHNDETMEECISRIVNRIIEKTGLEIPMPQSSGGRLWNNAEIQNARISQFEIICVPQFSACYRTIRSKFHREKGRLMERHAVCFWIASNGDLLCSCIGSSLFRILMLQDCTEQNIIEMHMLSHIGNVFFYHGSSGVYRCYCTTGFRSST